MTLVRRGTPCHVREPDFARGRDLIALPELAAVDRKCRGD